MSVVVFVGDHPATLVEDDNSSVKRGYVRLKWASTGAIEDVLSKSVAALPVKRKRKSVAIPPASAPAATADADKKRKAANTTASAAGDAVAAKTLYEFDKIIPNSHAKVNGKWQVRILWSNGEETNEDISSLKDSDPVSLAQYAQDHQLTEIPGWIWASSNKMEALLREQKRLNSVPDGVKFPAPINKREKLPPLPSVQTEGIVYAISEVDEMFYARHLWGGNKLIVKNIKLPHPIGIIERTFDLGGCAYHLVATKHEKRENRKPIFSDALSGPKGYVKAFYVADDDLEDTLNNLGNLKALPTAKAISRLELMVSPAARSTDKSPLAWMLPRGNFKVIEESNEEYMGCGFIPPSLMKQLGGPGAVAAQIRVFSRSLGWFKGMVVAKVGATQIELPPSMQKVEPSHNCHDDEDVFVLFNRLFPSKSNENMDRWLNPYLACPSQSSMKHLGGLKAMGLNLLLMKGVPRNVVEEYANRSQGDYEHRTWSFVVGVADPTGSLPPGSVFITGLGVHHSGSSRNVFVTRFPCTQASDGKLLPQVNRKPPSMTTQHWEHLYNIHFGLVVFGPPKPGESQIPLQIADGDLDGDLYLVIWDQQLLSFMTDPDADGAEMPDDDSKSSNSSGLFYDTDEEEPAPAADPLIGEIVSFVMDDGEKVTGLVVQKAPNSKYLCRFPKYGEKQLTLEEVMGDRDLMEEIVGHTLNGKDSTVEIRWKHSKETTTVPVKKLLREENDWVASELAEYARRHNLLDEWPWANTYVRNAGIVQILKHQNKKPKRDIPGNGPFVFIKWDDGDEDWHSVESLKNEDRDYATALQQYAKEKNLLQTRGWIWAKHALEQFEEEWFSKVQDVMCDMTRHVDHSRLYEVLHHLYQKSCNEDLMSEDTIAIGEAYKKSLEIMKHGGQVEFPYHLRHKVKEKNIQKYLRFLV
jgi:hypothetical protein